MVRFTVCNTKSLHGKCTVHNVFDQARLLIANYPYSSQQSKNYERARDAFEKVATGHLRQGSPWHSAKNLEKAADMAKQSGGLNVEVLYRDASRAYLEAGRTQTAAEALARAALHLESLDPKACSQFPLQPAIGFCLIDRWRGAWRLTCTHAMCRQQANCIWMLWRRWKMMGRQV